MRFFSVWCLVTSQEEKEKFQEEKARFDEQAPVGFSSKGCFSFADFFGGGDPGYALSLALVDSSFFLNFFSE